MRGTERTAGEARDEAREPDEELPLEPAEADKETPAEPAGGPAEPPPRRGAVGSGAGEELPLDAPEARRDDEEYEEPLSEPATDGPKNDPKSEDPRPTRPGR